jgi:predicted ATPase
MLVSFGIQIKQLVKQKSSKKEALNWDDGKAFEEIMGN